MGFNNKQQTTNNNQQPKTWQKKSLEDGYLHLNLM